MATKLARISEMSRNNPEMIFTSIGHLINKDLLKECHESMDGKKAKGIDGVSKADYYHYYGSTDNSQMLGSFLHRVNHLLYKWLNRRSQKRSLTWQGYNDLLKDYPLKKPSICYSIYGDF